MPITVNGVGTAYWGHKNASARAGICAACNRAGTLQSYDTRLWIVVLFIPLIPLGRKRIIDECSACRRHFVAGADAYEQAKQLQTSGALERYQREPSPDTAIAVHGQLLGFHEHDQAAEFRTAALQKFPRHAGLRVGLAQHLQQVASFAESAQLFQAAYDLAPDDPGARTGVASQKMNEGDLDGARGLLGFLEEPGAGQYHSLGPLDILAGYYQRAGRHDETLELAAVLLREWPDVANQHPFRAFVKKSEKALGRRSESLLPRQPVSLLGLFRAKNSPYAPWQRVVAIGGVVVILLAAGLALNNEYIRRHRTLHVVNACGAPVQVQVDDEQAVTVSGLGTLAVAEGTHTIHVTGAVDETHQVEIATGYLGRWFRHPAWVLNPGGEAVLQETVHTYAVNPPPSRPRLIVGQTFITAPNFDYVFEKAPARMNVSNNTPVVKTELIWVQGEDAEAFYATEATDRGTALAFAERRLKRHPTPRGLLKAYLSRLNVEDLPRVTEFLRTGLDARPINVPWHRAYQSLAESNTPEAELLARYDRYLEAEPQSAALLYLRGRIEPDEGKEAAYFRRAIDADDKLVWPWIGLAAQAETWGRWPKALDALGKARELSTGDMDTEFVDELTHAARLGVGQAEGLIEEYRTRLAANAVDVTGLIFLVDALVTAGKADEVEEAVAAFEGRLPPAARLQVGPLLRAAALYQEGKAKESEATCAQIATFQQSPVRAQALLALGKPRQAADDQTFAKVWDDPWNALALSVAFSLGGQADDAARWRDRAREKSRQPRLTQVLAAATAPSLDSLSSLHLRISEKALLLAALAARFPMQQDEYLRLAAKLNVRRSAPYLLVRQAIDRKFGPRP